MATLPVAGAASASVNGVFYNIAQSIEVNAVSSTNEWIPNWSAASTTKIVYKTTEITLKIIRDATVNTSDFSGMINASVVVILLDNTTYSMSNAWVKEVSNLDVSDSTFTVTFEAPTMIEYNGNTPPA